MEKLNVDTYEIAETQLQELKNIELDIFKQFLRVCRELHLKYYLVCGTLLGAVRHGGFIPWDDDIDVGMPREDYEVFVKKGQTLLPDPYFLQTNETDPEFSANFAKIRNSNTTFVETSLRHCKVNHGVYIDIFPLDYYPEGKITEIRFQTRNYFLMGRIAGSFYFPEKLRLISRIKHAVCRMIYPSLEKTLQRRDRLLKNVSAGSTLANHCGVWGKKEIMPVQWFGEGATLQFEGLTVTGPLEYQKYLTQVYGDYMQYPPVEKRKGHHYCDQIDLRKSYKEYMK